MTWNSVKRNTREQGQETEEMALEFLKNNGLTLISKNFQCRCGEIDLIVDDNGTIVFVEVKYRKSDKFGGPLLAVSKDKIHKLTKTAQFYLQQAKLNEYNTPCRFDIVSLLGSMPEPEITWLKNAF